MLLVGLQEGRPVCMSTATAVPNTLLSVTDRPYVGDCERADCISQGVSAAEY